MLKGRTNASSIVGVSKIADFLFFEGGRKEGPEGSFKDKKILILETPTTLL